VVAKVSRLEGFEMITKEIDIFKGSYYYNKFIESFYDNDSMILLEPTNNNVSKAIFYHLTQFRLAEWKMRVKFKRMVKHQSSDFFQDLICFYLKILLTNDYEFILEEGKKNKINKNIRVDIAINNKKYIFVIEVKTTTGWDRINNKNEDIYCDRIKEISNLWQINENNVIYILETAGNSNSEFELKFLDRSTMQPKDRGDLKKPYSHMYPLFCFPADPYYWDEFKTMSQDEKDREVPPISNDLIFNKAITIFPFEQIFKMIINSK
jgi:hypothetical protein